ncbi:MAG TPA: heme ABC exporter ATP-binding protein CcmA [Longimicrobiales bacterium]|nr:heme ABC exporter ATP-binding protein CcmA [Longimicrobiales bacterium]
MLRRDATGPASGSAGDTASAICLQGVARRFGQRWVLRGIDLDVEAGAIVALTGRNGSGKTTLLRIMATLLRPTRGSAAIFGCDTVREPDGIRERVGLLGHNHSLYDDLTAAENLQFSLRMAGRPAAGAAIDGALEHVGLAYERDERVRGFSAGMRRRLGLARLLLRPPLLLLLDEPYSNFDQDGIDIVNRFALDTAARGGVVILSTHDLARALDVLSRRVHIADGRLTEVIEGGAAHAMRVGHGGAS